MLAYMWVQYKWRPEYGIRHPGTLGCRLWTTSGVSWEPDSGYLQEQYALLPTEPPLQPQRSYEKGQLDTRGELNAAAREGQTLQRCPHRESLSWAPSGLSPCVRSQLLSSLQDLDHGLLFLYYWHSVPQCLSVFGKTGNISFPKHITEIRVGFFFHSVSGIVLIYPKSVPLSSYFGQSLCIPLTFSLTVGCFCFTPFHWVSSNLPGWWWERTHLPECNKNFQELKT